MDIVGLLPICATQKKLGLVATDYFSKWVEVKAYVSIKENDITKFVWKNIVCRFGIPYVIIMDSGPQFNSSVFRAFYSKFNITNLYSTSQYPQGNGQEEATNKTLLTSLKKRLEVTKRR